VKIIIFYTYIHQNTSFETQSTTRNLISDLVGKSNSNNNAEKSKPSADGGYGGLKKGFLFGAGTRVKQTKKQPAKLPDTDSNELELITPKKSSKEDQYRFEEVQQAMRLNESLLQNKGFIDINES